MFDIIRERLRQGHRTARYPLELPVLPDRFRGLPVLDAAKCESGCSECAKVCPTDAITANGKGSIDLGRCLFCTDAPRRVRPARSDTTDHRLAVRAVKICSDRGNIPTRRSEGIRRCGCSAGRSSARVSAAGATVAGRRERAEHGRRPGPIRIEFVAAPHADGLLITGGDANVKLALKKTYDRAAAQDRVAVGACAISGGPYLGHAEQSDGADQVVPVDLYVPGCPPHPYTILDGLLRLLDKLPTK